MAKNRLLNNEDAAWLLQKRKELKRVLKEEGERVKNWDLYNFIRIIDIVRSRK